MPAYNLIPHPPSIYADVNESRDRAWYDCDAIHIKYDAGLYELSSRMIGRGTFGKVYEARRRGAKEYNLAIKVISAVIKEKKIKREIKILENLKGQSSHIIQLIDFYKTSDSYYLVFPLVKNVPLWKCIGHLTRADIVFIMYQLVSAIHVMHLNGIVHSDMKPSNFLFNGETKHVTIIDFGHSFFYFPCQQHSLYTGTVSYKAPELLLRWPYFHYAVDLWSIGRIFFDLLFPHHIYQFRRRNNYEQLLLISQMMGSGAIIATSQLLGTTCYSLSPRPARSLEQWISDEVLGTLPSPKMLDFYKTRLSESTLDLLQKLLTVDPQQRITARECLRHCFFVKPLPTKVCITSTQKRRARTMDTQQQSQHTQ